MFAIFAILFALITPASACDEIAHPHIHKANGRVVYTARGEGVVLFNARLGTGVYSHRHVHVDEAAAGRRYPHHTGTGLHVHTGGGLSLHRHGYVQGRKHPQCPRGDTWLWTPGTDRTQGHCHTGRYCPDISHHEPVHTRGTTVVRSASVPQTVVVETTYNTNALTYAAVDRYRGVEPWPRREQDASVCYAEEPPTGWEHLPAVRKLQIDNETDSFLVLSVQMRASESDRRVVESMGMDVVGGKAAADYHMPLQIAAGTTALAPGETCYGILPLHDDREPVWSVTAVQYDAAGPLGQWWIDDNSEMFYYGDQRGRPILMRDLGHEDAKGIVDRGQKVSKLIWHNNDFR